MSDRPQSASLGVAVGAASLLLIVHALRVYPWFLSDDAFILLRYGRNLARGYGLVWNVGEAAVEGFTSLLQVLLFAVTEGFGFEAMVSMQVLGMLFAALLLSI